MAESSPSSTYVSSAPSRNGSMEPPPSSAVPADGDVVVVKRPPPHTAAVLDALAVDTYLLQTFVASKLVAVFRSSTLFPDDSAWASRIVRTVTLPLVQTATLLSTGGQTPSVRWLGLELVQVAPANHRNNHRHHRAAAVATFVKKYTANIRYRLVAYAALRFAAPALYTVFKDWVAARRRRLTAMLLLHNNNNNHADSEDDAYQRERVLVLALQRQCDVSDALVQAVDRVLPVLQLAALLSCWSGVTDTCDPAMLLTGLTYRRQTNNAHSQQPAPLGQQLHVTYAHRRWLYEQGLETAKLLFAGWTIMGSRTVWRPLVQEALLDPAVALVRRIRRRLMAVTAGTSAATTKTKTNEDATVCPICRGIPATAAVRADCGHVYCYACLYYYQQQQQQQQQQSLGRQKSFHCKICHGRIATATAHYLNTLPPLARTH